jgi:hypothetical protein
LRCLISSDASFAAEGVIALPTSEYFRPADGDLLQGGDVPRAATHGTLLITRPTRGNKGSCASPLAAKAQRRLSAD